MNFGTIVALQWVLIITLDVMREHRSSVTFTHWTNNATLSVDVTLALVRQRKFFYTLSLRTVISLIKILH